MKIGQPLVSVGREQQAEEELKRFVGLLFSSFSFLPWPLVVAEKWEGPGAETGTSSSSNSTRNLHPHLLPVYPWKWVEPPHPFHCFVPACSRSTFFLNEEERYFAPVQLFL